MPVPSKQDLNRLYAASLDFGGNWRRPIPELALERFPHQPEEYRHVLALAVEDCRNAVESHIEQRHLMIGGNWTRAEVRDVDSWLSARYPWMTRKNRRHALRQGQYYAWHDRG